MSTTVDQQVVEMRFDNKNFENNIATTMSSLEKFKQKLNLDGATKGLENVDAAAKRVNLSSLGSAVDTVGLRFNALWTIADQTLRNITNSAYNTGKQLLSSLTVDPIKTGLQEYETQINAVQTILANTESKGTTLKDVNGALDELNTYADKTIYNFTEMTRNIGTFTAAGVDLDTSVNAIQGIANLAAVSGSTSQQASTAMYQLSQAMASGTVKLMDWNSVVNAGMGGQVFQDALKETAKVHGVNVDKMIKKHGSFRETLKEGWITTDILTETLSHFTMAAEEGSKEWGEFKKSLMDQGYSEAQATAILKMSNTATNAATKVKTATQLFDTLKETAQSGWTQTWEIIFGDFEEAKTLFSSLYETLAPILEASAKTRNELLQGWADLGGRNDLIESLNNVFDAIGSIVKPIKEAFQEIFPPATAEQLFNITKTIKEFTEKLTLSETASDNLKRTFKGLFAILDIGKQALGALFKVLSPLFGKVDNLGGGILGTTAKWGDWLVALNESIKTSGFFAKAVDSIHKGFEKVAKFLAPVIEGFKRFGNEIAKTVTAASNTVKTRFQPLVALGNFIKSIFVGIGNAIKKVFPFITTAASSIGKVLSDLMGKITESIQNADYDKLFDLTSGGIMTAIGVYIAKFFKSGSGIFDGAAGLVENLNGILEGAGDALGAFTDSLKADTLKKIATAIAILAASLLVLALIPSEKLTVSLLAITAMFGELMGSMAIFGKMGDMKGVNKTTRALISLAAALFILSLALKIMSTMSWSEMGVGLISMTTALGAMIGVVWALPKEKELNGASKAISSFAKSLVIMALALKIMGSMSWEEMGIALISMATALGAMVGVVWALPNEKELASASKAISSLSKSLVIMALALKIMGSMSWEEMAIGLISMTVALGAMIGTVWALPKDIGSKATGILVLAAALTVLSIALKIMASMSWEEMARGLITMAIALGVLIGVFWALAKAPNLLVTAGALAAISGALIVLGLALKLMASMSWEEVARGLLTLAGAFVIIGVAGLVLGPIAPVIMTLAGAVALLGVGILAAGVGVTAFAVGLTALAAALAASGGAITVFVASIISLIPYLIEQIGVGIIKLCEVIAGSADAICKAATVIILALVDALVTSVPAIVEGALVLIEELLKSLVNHTPMIVTYLFDFLIGIIDAIAEKLPDLIQAGTNLIMSLFQGIIDSLKSIDPTVLINGILSIGMITALMAALALCASLAGPAMAGVLAVGAVIAELAIVLAAIGALAQIPGIDWLISDGGDLMQTIGTAIGQFIGGIVGGIAQGISSSLPQIGTDLSAFMQNATPFIEGAKSIDSATFAGVRSLVDIILALTGANILEGLTSWLTGGSSLTKFGEELAAFAPNIRAYADTVSGIDGSAVTASATAAKALAEMTSHIPNEGGMVAWFTGENSISKFGKDLVVLGDSLSSYSESISGFNGEAVIASANAATALADMTSHIPNEGGVAAWFAGENSISKWGKDLVTLGNSLAMYSLSIMFFNADAVIASANAAQALVDMTSKIPNEGGVAAWFAGENSISKWGEDLVSLGNSLAMYSLSIVDFNAEAVIASANAAQALVDMTSKIPNEGGVAAWFVGENSISKWGEDLVSLGNSLAMYSLSIVGFNAEAVIASANAAQALVDMTSKIPNEGGVVAWFAGENSISKWGQDLVTLGSSLSMYSLAITGFNAEAVIASANAAQALVNMTSTIPNEGGIQAWFTGESSISKFGTDLVSLGEGLKGFSDAVTGIDIESVAAATGAAKSLAEMASTIPNEGGIQAWFSGDNSLSKFSTDIVSLGEGLKGFSDSVAGVNPESITAAAGAAKSLAEMASVIPNEGGIKAWFSGDNSIASFGDKLPILGNGLKGFSDAVSGIVPENIVAAANAAKALAQMADSTPDNTDNIVTFGENLASMGTKMRAYFDKMSGVTQGALSSAYSAIRSVKNITTGFDSSGLKNAADAIDELVKAINKMARVKSSAADGFSDAIEKLSETNIDAMIKAFKNAGPDVKKIGEDIIAKFIGGVENEAANIVKAGKLAIQKFIDGIKAHETKAKTTCTRLVNSCSSTISKLSSKFKSSGKDLGDGLVIGINSKKIAVYNAAYDLGQEAVRGEKDGQKSKSPSKATIQAGHWLGEGLIIGIEQMGRKVYNAGSALGNSATKTISSAISRISDSIHTDIDTQPTIRPILDLSDIKSGTSAISGMLNMESSVGVRANLGVISSMMTTRSQNRGNADVVSALDKLNKKMDNIGNTTYTINGITYDDGSNISTAVADLVRAARIERRV